MTCHQRFYTNRRIIFGPGGPSSPVTLDIKLCPDWISTLTHKITLVHNEFHVHSLISQPTGFKRPLDVDLWKTPLILLM